MSQDHLLSHVRSQFPILISPFSNVKLLNYCIQRSSIGAVGVRLCSSAQPRMPLEFENLKLPGFAEGSGRPLTASWLCFMLKYGCQAPIAANAHVSTSFTLLV